MATKKYVKDSAKEGKFGHYKTSTGGGEPIPAGKKWTNEKRDPDQARDSQGRFTYNAVNGKPLKEISKSHGHSRGTTIPPTLTGGVGGIHYYSDSTHEHIVKGGQDALEKYTSFTVEEAYRKGDRIVSFRGTIKIASKDFIESASEYMANKGKEDQLTGALADLAKAKESKDKEGIEKAVSSILESGHFAGEPTGSWKEREAESPEELRAIEKAKAEKTEGKELVERKREEEVEAAPKVKKFISWAKSWSSPSAPVSEKREETVSPVEVSKATESLSDEDIKKFSEKVGSEVTRSMLEEAFSDENSGIKSADDVKKLIGEETTSDEKVEEVADKVEEVVEDEPTETQLIDVLKGIDRKGLMDAISQDEGARGDILPFAKKWASDKEEYKDKDDIELVIAYVNEKLGKTETEEKEEIMKDFRGE